MPKQEEEEVPQRDALHDVTDDLRDIVAQTLNLGVSVARIIAEATSAGNTVPPPRQATALNAIVHYGVVSVVNVISTVTTGINETVSAINTDMSKAQASQANSTEPTPSKNTNRPLIHQGATLRIPLSIENTQAETMKDMEFMCIEIEFLDKTSEDGVYSRNWLRFEPAILSIAPNDFEKLTVFIDVPDDAQIGTYRAGIGLIDGTIIAEINFVVAAAQT